MAMFDPSFKYVKSWSVLYYFMNLLIEKWTLVESFSAPPLCVVANKIQD